MAAWVESLGPCLERLAAERPCLAAHARGVWANESDEALDGRFTFGLAAVLDGIETRLMDRSKG